MAGEMSRSEVTRETYPGLFDLMDALAEKGVESEPCPFDQYQGPYLRVAGGYRCWYHDDAMPDFPLFLIERGAPPINTFETRGADEIVKETPTALRHGIYTLDSATRRIARIARGSK